MLIKDRCDILIIGFAGKNGVGKTTMRQGILTKLDMLQMHPPINVVKFKISFAQQVKNCAKIFFGWDGRKDDRGRKLLQSIGTQIGRQYKQDCWIQHTIDSINQKISTIPFGSLLVVLIDDLRFQNQARWIIDSGGIIINLTRNVKVQLGDHTSELGFNQSLYTYNFNLDDGNIAHNVETVYDWLQTHIKDIIK